jgi:hypothetical protein
MSPRHRYYFFLHYLADWGLTRKEAAARVNISRQAVWKRQKKDPEFAKAYAAALEKGSAYRVYHLWLRHPFRGRRPPTGKGHGGKPRFTFGCPG